MLHFLPKESRQGSQFFIHTLVDNLHFLKLEKKDIEVIDFQNDFLQENIYELEIVKLTDTEENYCCSLADTVKHIFDDFLFRKDNAIIYISVDNTKWKSKLIKRYIDQDENDEFFGFSCVLGDVTIYFFMNKDKSNIIQAFNSILSYIRDEYGEDAEITI
jgi:arginine repressor